MGMLAESKSRKSIGKDPNNTKWTRNTTTFGQRILRSQGWEPGQYLGAKNAPHSELHTAANASYIRVAIKDDMKGLGFNKAKEDEVTGLDVFSDLLSRLNGKSQAEVDQDKADRLVIKTNRYVEQKWGPMRFVRGGLLVGDVLEEADTKKTAPTTTDTKITQDDDSKRKSKKRKVESLDDSGSESSSGEEEKQKRESKKRRKEEKKAKVEKKEEKKRKKEKKEKKEKGKLSEPVSTEASGIEDGSLKKGKQDKKKSKKAKDLEEETLSASASEEVAEPDENSSSAGNVEAKKSKKSKRDKKEKKEQKEKKRQKATASESQQDSESSDTNPSSTSAAAATSGKSTPALSGSGTSTPLLSQRNFVRSRFIAQKQRVLMDTEALNQILMIKT